MHPEEKAALRITCALYRGSLCEYLAIRASSTACCANRFVGWALRCLRTYEKYVYAGSSRSALASIRSRRLSNSLSDQRFFAFFFSFFFPFFFVFFT